MSNTSSSIIDFAQFIESTIPKDLQSYNRALPINWSITNNDFEKMTKMVYRYVSKKLPGKFGTKHALCALVLIDMHVLSPVSDIIHWLPTNKPTFEENEFLELTKVLIVRLYKNNPLKLSRHLIDSSHPFKDFMDELVSDSRCDGSCF